MASCWAENGAFHHETHTANHSRHTDVDAGPGPGGRRPRGGHHPGPGRVNAGTARALHPRLHRRGHRHRGAPRPLLQVGQRRGRHPHHHLRGRRRSHNPDAVTTFAGGGGGTDPRAVVGVTYEHTTKTFTFMQAGGATITCRTDADCPLPASQTIYAATSATTTFVATDFTDPATGFSVTGNPPLMMEFPSAVTGLSSTAWALPASLTLTGIAAYSNDNICRTYSTSTLDCATSTSITINGDAYHYYTYNDGRPGVVSPATLNWSE